MADEIKNSFSLTLNSSAIETTVSEIQKIGGDFMEVGIDSLVKDGLLKDVPIVSTVLSIGKVAGSISNYLLTKKIIRFLYQLKNTTIDERKKFLNELGSSKRNDILENLMLVIDRHDNYQKSDIQGKIFSAYIKGLISEFDYNKLTYAVSLMSTSSLTLLKNFYLSENNANLTSEQIYNFIFLQLIGIDNSKIGTWGGGGPRYDKNRLGLILVEIGTDTKIPDDFRETVLGHSNVNKF